MTINLFESTQAKPFGFFQSSGETDAIAEILSLAKTGASERDLIDQVKCPPVYLKSFLDYLLSNNLIEERKLYRWSDLHRETTFLYTTERGFRFLNHWNRLMSLLGSKPTK